MIRLLAAVASLTLFLVVPAWADVFQTYDLIFNNITSPAAHPTATVSGSVTLDTTALTDALAGNYNTELYLSPASNYVSAVDITVSGAAGGNGTFLLPMFATFMIGAPSAVNFDMQLIGQVTDFNFSANGNDATTPTEAGPLIMQLSDGETVELESIDPIVVAEPLSVAIFIIGLVGLVLAKRRRKLLT